MSALKWLKDKYRKSITRRAEPPDAFDTSILDPDAWSRDAWLGEIDVCNNLDDLVEYKEIIELSSSLSGEDKKWLLDLINDRIEKSLKRVKTIAAEGERGEGL